MLYLCYFPFFHEIEYYMNLFHLFPCRYWNIKEIYWILMRYTMTYNLINRARSLLPGRYWFISQWIGFSLISKSNTFHVISFNNFSLSFSCESRLHSNNVHLGVQKEEAFICLQRVLRWVSANCLFIIVVSNNKVKKLNEFSSSNSTWFSLARPKKSL